MLDLGDSGGEQSEAMDELDDGVDGKYGAATKTMEQRRQAKAFDGSPSCGPGQRGHEHDQIVT